MFSTNLTSAQLERLALLVEECGETIQAVGKTLRHGYDSRNPLQSSGETNREWLAREVGQLLFAIQLVTPDLDAQRITQAQEEKQRTIGRWLHASENVLAAQEMTR